MEERIILKIVFLDITATRLPASDEQLREAFEDKGKLDEIFNLFPHAKLLYEDFLISVLGGS